MLVASEMTTGLKVLNLRGAGTVLLAASLGALVGCGSDGPPPPDLAPQAAAEAIVQQWSQEQMNHFKVTFHSDNLVECGVRNDLWKLVEVTDRNGNAWTTTYRLTDKGSKIVTAIGLKESGRGHEILLKGPYRIEVNGITDGTQPNTKNVAFRWDIDWDKAPEDLKACLPRFELSGNEVALFQLDNNGWRFTSYLNAEEIQALPQPDSGPPPAPAVGLPLGH
jgi:YD repeat-containing protein